MLISAWNISGKETPETVNTYWAGKSASLGDFVLLCILTYTFITFGFWIMWMLLPIKKTLTIKLENYKDYRRATTGYYYIPYNSLSFLYLLPVKDNQYIHFIHTNVYQVRIWESGEITLKVTRQNFLWKKKKDNKCNAHF